MSAYCETCAAIGNVYLNYRLFLLHGEAKYYDVLERTFITVSFRVFLWMVVDSSIPIRWKALVNINVSLGLAALAVHPTSVVLSHRCRDIFML